MMSLVLAFLITVVGACLLAGLGNRSWFRLSPRWAPIALTPWWEEGLKLGVALLFPRAPLLGIHLVFGLVELSYNLWRSPSDKLFLGLLALVAHGLTGGPSALVASLTHLGWGYLTGVTVHTAFNWFAVSVMLPDLGAAGAPAPHRDG